MNDESFNWFEDAPVGGYPSPEEAVRRYIEGLARGDLPAVQSASRLIVTRPVLARRQKETFALDLRNSGPANVRECPDAPSNGPARAPSRPFQETCSIH